MKFRFTAEMFEDLGLRHELSGALGPCARHVAEHANALLEAEEAKCERVEYFELGSGGKSFLSRDPNRTALLWNVEPIGEGEK